MALAVRILAFKSKDIGKLVSGRESVEPSGDLTLQVAQVIWPYQVTSGHRPWFWGLQSTMYREVWNLGPWSAKVLGLLVQNNNCKCRVWAAQVRTLQELCPFIDRPMCGDHNLEARYSVS